MLNAPQHQSAADGRSMLRTYESGVRHLLTGNHCIIPAELYYEQPLVAPQFMHL